MVSGFLTHIKKSNMACFNLMQRARRRDTSIRSETRRHAVLLALLILFWLHSSNTHMLRCTCMCTSTRRHACPKFSSKSYWMSDFVNEWVNEYKIQHMSPRWPSIGGTKKMLKTRTWVLFQQITETMCLPKCVFCAVCNCTIMKWHPTVF